MLGSALLKRAPPPPPATWAVVFPLRTPAELREPVPALSGDNGERRAESVGFGSRDCRHLQGKEWGRSALGTYQMAFTSS